MRKVKKEKRIRYEIDSKCILDRRNQNGGEEENSVNVSIRRDFVLS